MGYVCVNVVDIGIINFGKWVLFGMIFVVYGVGFERCVNGCFVLVYDFVIGIVIVVLINVGCLGWECVVGYLVDMV